MYDELSPLAQDVAQLCPYLGDSWNIHALAVTLGKAETLVADAVEELKDRGIVFAASSTEKDALTMLPLTADFLANKWNENGSLRQQVERQLAETILSGAHRATLFQLPVADLVRVLRDNADRLRGSKDFDGARKLVRYAMTRSVDPIWQFLEGRIQYEAGHKGEGLSNMRAALERGQSANWANEQIYFARALLTDGRREDEGHALSLLAETANQWSNFHREVIELFCHRALELEDYELIAKAVQKTTDGEPLYWLIKALSRAFENSALIFWCGHSLVTALRKTMKVQNIDASERRELELSAVKIQALLAKGPTN